MEHTMRFPKGTVVQNFNDFNNPVVVTEPNLDWSNDWKKVGVVVYDPKPIEVGDCVRNLDDLFRGVVLCIDGNHVGIRWTHFQSYDGWEKYKTGRYVFESLGNLVLYSGE
jgi:hypothetical protein